LTAEAEEYKKLLLSLYNEYIQKKTAQFRYNSFPLCSSSHPSPLPSGSIPPQPPTSSLSTPPSPPPDFTVFEIRRELENSLHPIELMRSIDTVNLIRDCKDDNDLYTTLHRDALGSLVSTLRKNIQVAKVAARETGHLDAIDNNFEPLLDGISYDHLTPQDAEILRKLGFCDAETELRAIVYRIKNKKGQWATIMSAGGLHKPSEIFEKAEKHLTEKEQSIRSQSENERIVGTKWFTQLGGLIKGCGLVIGNIGSLFLTSGASGVVSIPSTTAGIAEVLDWHQKVSTM
jgi:hypothetical protein